MTPLPLNYLQYDLGVDAKVIKRSYPDRRFPQYGLIFGEGRERLRFDRGAFDQILAPLAEQVGPLIFPRLTDAQRGALASSENGLIWVSAPPRGRSRLAHTDDSLRLTKTTSFWCREPMPGVSTGWVGFEPGMAVLRPHAEEVSKGESPEQAHIQELLRASEKGPFADARSYTASAVLSAAMYPLVEDRIPQIQRDLKRWAIEVNWGEVEYVVFHPEDLHFAWKGTPPAGRNLVVADTYNRIC